MSKTLEKEIEKANPVSYTVDDLTWQRIITPQLIPKNLIEQIKHKDYEIDDLYQFFYNNVEIESHGVKRLNPFLHIYALLDPDFKIRGVIWFTIDPLTKNLLVQNYSVEKEFWGKGKAVQKLHNMIKSIMEGANIKKAFYISRYPKHAEKNGFKRSKDILFEYILPE